MKALSWVVIGLILVFGAGCASSSSSPAASTTGAPANVAGTWSGGFYGPASNSISMQLQQQGSAVTGTIQVGGRTDLDGPLKGTLRGNMMDYTLANGGAGTMEVSGNAITGTVSGSPFRALRQ
jgi:hypothetical protein